MFIVLRHRPFRRLFAAHVVALLGTGLSTIAIGFLVVDVAGGDAAAVLGTLLAIKMFTFLLLGPLAPAIARRVGTRRLLVATDITRALIAVCLPFVDSIGVAYLLIFLLQGSSALFTPTFQAALPRIVTDEREYTGALALSRLAYDLESLASPSIAAAVLVFAPSSMLFLGTGVGFLGSALLILSVAIPKTTGSDDDTVRSELTRGIRLMFTVGPLRGALALHLALAAVGAIAMVLTVPLVRSELGGTEAQAAGLLAAFGAGSLASAALMPSILKRVAPRPYMLTGLSVFATAMLFVWPVLAMRPGTAALPWLCAIWFISGAGNSAVLAPMGRIYRDAVTDRDLPHVFAAQFSLAHGWWLLTYPIAGWGATLLGFGPITLVLATAALLALLLAARLWTTLPAGSRDPSGTMEARREGDHG
ncbi:MFS transporter [Microbacterium oxydans]|uniref:Enterobactin exporter EntS n=1 Tax=Microbacterium oxydans TaxID=82380 RepID=A0A0F0LBY2_9MICO|nr:MFS transporter [Microbacterium oxydans]KJL29081.1 enterobactin exporter EntS [Microbacterium oxydans]